MGWLRQDVEQGLLLVPAVIPVLWGLPGCPGDCVAWGHAGLSPARGSPER